MSIPDLIKKINAWSVQELQPPQSAKKAQIMHIALLWVAIVLGVTASGGIGYLISKYQAPEPIQILCSDEVTRALEASSTPIKLEKTPSKSGFIPKPTLKKSRKTKKNNR